LELDVQSHRSVILTAITLASIGIYAPAPANAQLKLPENLPWRAIGPAIMGGRINDFAVVDTDPSTFYVATAAGGIFKTTNNGTTFKPIFENFETGSIGDLAVSQSHPDVLYVGSGESNNRQSSSWGNGMYKSTDGGTTFTQIGLEKTQHIGRVVVHPTNPDVLYVAAMGRLWGGNEERGVYKSTDGGKTWERVLFVNNLTGCTDIVMDPQNPDVLIAAMYQRQRSPFGYAGSGPGSGLHKSTDGGKTWTKLTKGLPETELGRIGLDIYKRNGKILYATVESKNSGSTQTPAGNGGLYRSDDGGESWVYLSDTNPRPMYFSQVRIDPNNDQNVWVLGVSMYYSKDGGKTFPTVVTSQVHADGHAIWINPKDSRHIILGCDGGIQASYDTGKSWDFINTFPISQPYEVGYDFRFPYNVYAGLQDNGTWGSPSRTLDSRGVTNDEWFNIQGGDGFQAKVDPTNPDIVYAESQNGAVSRINPTTGESKSIRPRDTTGDALRWDWNTPISLSPHDPKTIYVAANKLFISKDRGDHWVGTKDLTRGLDRNKLPIMGREVTKAVMSSGDGENGFSEIVTVEESPAQKGVLWVGVDDGNLQLSKDGGATWENFNGKIPGLPKDTFVSRVVPSRFAAGRCYVTFDGHRSDDFTPYIYVTEDFGQTWKKITNGIPEFHTLSVIREHHRAENLLFAGSERGLYVSFDRGASWQKAGAPLPTVPVDDIQIHPRDNDLILATHGRGIYILDDIAALEVMATGGTSQKVALAPVRPGVQYRISRRKATTGQKFYIAPNPQSSGATVLFYLKDDVDPAAIKIEVLDKKNKVVRNLTASNPGSGWNRVAWDLRMDAAQGATGGFRGFEDENEGGDREGSFWSALSFDDISDAGSISLMDPAVALFAQGQGAGGRQGAGNAQGGGRGGQGAGNTTSGQRPGAGAGAAQGGGGGRGFGGGGRGPRVLPGTYTIRLTVGDTVLTQPVAVHDDPRVALTAGQRKEIFDAQIKAGELQKELTATRTELDEYRRQVTGAVLTAEGPAKEALDALSKQISALSLRIQAPTPNFGGRGFGGGRGAGAAGAAAPAGTPGAAGTRPAPVMNEIEREQMMLQMQRAISATITGQLSSVVSTLESFTLPVTAETKADIKELSGKLKSLTADVRKIGSEVRKVVPAPVKKD
jgi:photosystem II stability/assembly factor-like uncharacterized protein